MTTRMRQLEEAWPEPTPEDEAKCVRVVVQHGGHDLLPMLGLDR